VVKKILFVALAWVVAPVQEEPVKPYVDPGFLDCPFPKHSHVKQPWRAWMETRPGTSFLSGVGINYNVPANDDLAVRLLAEAGIRAVRKEIGWGSVRWDESGVSDEPRLKHQLELFKRHGLRPTFLLNCHQGVPCPAKFFEERLLEDAPKDSKTVRLGDLSKIEIGRTGLSGLTDYWAAEALATSVEPSTGKVTLSKPLPKALQAGRVPLATLKYLPLYPPGTPEFDETVAGWIRYAKIVGALAVQAGLDDFDCEIFNELTFGTKFLDIRNYRPDLPRLPKDFLHEGGTCWELARRLAEALKKEFPKCRLIWGFSNTTFFHCPVDQLPPGIDGQSYHPYGTGTRRLPDQEYHRGAADENLDGWTAEVTLRLSEGWSSTFVQTESLMRLLEPDARRKHPPGGSSFRHYMTEHGVLASECGVKDAAGAWALKTKCATRSYVFWLNKGIEALHYFCAYEKEPESFGLLPPELPRLPREAAFEEVATPPLRAIRALTRVFSDSRPLRNPSPLSVEVVAIGAQAKIFDGPRPLWHRDVLAVLPWQTGDDKHVVALYVMTWDAVPSIPEERYRLKLRGARGSTVRLVDPVLDKELPVRIVNPDPERLELEVSLVETPRLLVLSP
jgi:hypothetical protein